MQQRVAPKSTGEDYIPCLIDHNLNQYGSSRMSLPCGSWIRRLAQMKGSTIQDIWVFRHPSVRAGGVDDRRGKR